MLSIVVLILAAVTTVVNCQYAVTIDPSSVPLSTRQAWCRDQKSTCPLLCLQVPGSKGASVNDCSAESLSYQCICSNKVSPNASEYSQTLPYYVCTETNNQCVNKCANGDSGCQSACRQDNPCGAQNPKRMNVTTTASAAATSTTQANPLGTNPATGGASCMNILEAGHVYGLCVLVGGFVAGLAVFL